MLSVLYFRLFIPVILLWISCCSSTPDIIKAFVLNPCPLTGLGVDAEETLRVPAADLVAQFVAGASVGVEGVDLND